MPGRFDLPELPPALRRLTKSGWPAGFELVQFPNPPLAIALLASLAGRFTGGTGHRLSLAIFYVSLGVWAYLEARHGDNWFRQLLGVGFLVYIVVDLTRALHA